MSADESLDQQPASVLAVLAARYPHWTIWFGQATRHWWALPPHGQGGDMFIEAPNVKELVESIEVIQARHRASAPSRQPGGILFGEAETSRAGRVPAAAWHGGRR
ncbi:hypothetical protein [Actinomadura sp. DC4]|uniref:hypothetical protein n=1 Tax=Actinomadura sp. DC4 TaxID=3055069 RepID=UPI0025B11E9D|nr:hypothetical protein [Actinomadura sp. DC4]MDN3356567.1 hypothetical protein [Actinomadura sp. DC4]